MRWWRRRGREEDLERELRSDLELEAAEQQESGLSAEQARYAALRALGNTTLVKEEVRRTWGWPSVEFLGQDIRFSLRMLRKSPGFVVFAVLALALGLGANAAIFSVVDAVLLRPLPFRNADRLVEVWEEASHMGFPLAPLAPANFADWKRRNPVFGDMAALKGDLYALTGNGTPEQVEGSPVTANLFQLLGVSPILGRDFSPEEDRPGGGRVVLISYGLWQRRFAGDTSVVGREILLSNQKYRVIGVMPRGVTFPEKSQIWLPLALGPREWALRDDHYLRVFARLKPGVTFAQAQREMAGLAAQLRPGVPENEYQARGRGDQPARPARWQFEACTLGGCCRSGLRIVDCLRQSRRSAVGPRRRPRARVCRARGFGSGEGSTHPADADRKPAPGRHRRGCRRMDCSLYAPLSSPSCTRRIDGLV
jgi:hypothetical protein